MSIHFLETLWEKFLRIGIYVCMMAHGPDVRNDSCASWDHIATINIVFRDTMGDSKRNGRIPPIHFFHNTIDIWQGLSII